jgi:fatty-acyl-CoA synthase
MTETSAIISSTLETDSFELRSSTVGQPQAHTAVKIINPATGELVGFGERGELLARGPSTMRGYYNMPEKTAEAIDSDGWVHTGDLATMNEQGYLNIVGRVKDMIIRGGENIYPAEIEAFLMRHPKIAEVQVIGVPDSYMGEEVAALMRLKAGEEATEDEIREYCRANISRFKVPKYYKFVSEFPMTASGKVKKFELKKQVTQELGLEELAATKTA